MKCPNCGHAMNHHADKLLLDGIEPDSASGSQVIEAYSCPHCGTNASGTVNSE
jgi:predicted RNA-binding Zn-ribbon protein involved in translation (DUF1610 family)